MFCSTVSFARAEARARPPFDRLPFLAFVHLLPASPVAHVFPSYGRGDHRLVPRLASPAGKIGAVQVRAKAVRARREDLPLLVTHFVDRAASRFGRRVSGLTVEAWALVDAYDWPGNVASSSTP